MHLLVLQFFKERVFTVGIFRRIIRFVDIFLKITLPYLYDLPSKGIENIDLIYKLRFKTNLRKAEFNLVVMIKVLVITSFHLEINFKF